MLNTLLLEPDDDIAVRGALIGKSFNPAMTVGTKFELADSAVQGNQKTWAFSAWVKMTNPAQDLGGQPIQMVLFSTTVTMGASEEYIAASDFGGDKGLIRLVYHSGATGTDIVTSAGLAMDSSAWYHIVFIYDSTQAAQEDRGFFYINGEKVVNKVPNTIALNQDSVSGTVNKGRTLFSFGNGIGGSTYASGSMRFADIHYVDGVKVTAADFGEMAEGLWVPKKYTGQFGAKGFHLDFDDTGGKNPYDDRGPNKIGHRFIGEPVGMAANWAPYISVDIPSTSGLDTTGLGGSMSGNYCIMAPWASTAPKDVTSDTRRFADGGDGVRTLGQYTTAVPIAVPSTMRLDSGKWYAEFNHGSHNDQVQLPHSLSFGLFDWMAMTDPLRPANAPLWYPTGVHTNANIYTTFTTAHNDGTTLTTQTDAAAALPAYQPTDVSMVAYDADTGQVWLGRNGYWYGGGNPSTKANPTYTLAKKPRCFGVTFWPSTGKAMIAANFGAKPYVHKAPTGFNPVVASALADFAPSTTGTFIRRLAGPQYVYTGGPVATLSINGVPKTKGVHWAPLANGFWLMEAGSIGTTYTYDVTYRYTPPLNSIKYAPGQY